MRAFRRFRQWLTWSPDHVLDEVRAGLETAALDIGGERVVRWDERRTRALLGLPDGS